MFKNIIYFSLLLSVMAASCLFNKSARPPQAKTLPTHFVVIGCSAAGFHAARELKKLDGSARVTCISEESYNPSKRLF